MLNTFHLTVLSITITILLHQSLKRAFWFIEKAHEHLRESDRLRGAGELVGEQESR